MIVGKVQEIVRHPVKSFRGESVEKTRVESYGVYGDRSHAFLDDTRPGKYLTLTQEPVLAKYHAKFVGEENLEKYPIVKITSPSGKEYEWGEEELLQELEQFSGKSLTPIQYSPDYVPLGAIEEDDLLITTKSSIKKIEELWGSKVDVRRFRPNFVLSTESDEPFIEETWLGKKLLIGNVKVIVNGLCERCSIINIDPDSATIDTSMLKTVYKERNNCFGIFASVIKTGEVNVGDEVTLL
ncbi:MOSC domain-containing protein [Robertmurraya kyonggiensis]|uniref:MOSC domain-containing protein n=1 Tax=Robertmurraya kyonggiensis TaxID=1037680 RepID=A0A4U1D171_9BACI|nr:MOSC N-terminal beta barrel domain-containing protein [Robertmurraya kyonggiensis]TKC16065.1 MOSC domain-containing protein [Robertmurraya kyonggiensis]